MPTERQSESARINGAKSHGPKSAEGKKKSSRNALRHGCTAGHTILLACEDRGDFKRMRKDYDTMYKPVTMEEQNLVAEMFATAWRLRRIHQQNYDMLLRLRQQRQSEPAPPEPSPAPAPAPTPPPAIPQVVQADSLHETKGLQNEPAAQHRHRRFRSRRERKMQKKLS